MHGRVIASVGARRRFQRRREIVSTSTDITFPLLSCSPKPSLPKLSSTDCRQPPICPKRSLRGPGLSAPLPLRPAGLCLVSYRKRQPLYARMRLWCTHVRLQSSFAVIAKNVLRLGALRSDIHVRLFLSFFLSSRHTSSSNY